MPGMDGLTLCQSLKRLHPPMVAMLVTAYGDPDLDKQAKAAGACSCSSSRLIFHSCLLSSRAP